MFYIFSRRLPLQDAKIRPAHLDLYPQFLEKGATVIGVSKDSVETQKEFQKEYNLPFLLLSDEELEVIKLYDVLKEKMMFGRPAMGLERTTYLIDEDGIIIKAFEKGKTFKKSK